MLSAIRPFIDLLIKCLASFFFKPDGRVDWPCSLLVAKANHFRMVSDLRCRIFAPQGPRQKHENTYDKVVILQKISHDTVVSSMEKNLMVF
jgi:hypothetical protein